MTERCYSNDGEYFYKDFCSITYDAEVGQSYFEGDASDLLISDVMSIHTVNFLLEQLDEACYEEVGEIADCPFTSVSKEAMVDLQKMIAEWANKHVSLPYYKVRNVVEKTFTKEDLE